MSNRKKRAANRPATHGLNSWLKRARSGLTGLLGRLSPAPRPAVQPVAARSPRRRAQKPAGER